MLTRSSDVKVRPVREVAAAVADRRAIGERLVLCHGCFDLVHIGHLRHFEHAKSFGEILAVSVTADEFVAKGDGRPCFPINLRMEFLAALELVDFVVLSPEATALANIEVLRPDVYAKGPDYRDSEHPGFLAEQQLVVSSGGSVIFTGSEVVNSSSSLLRHINK